MKEIFNALKMAAHKKYDLSIHTQTNLDLVVNAWKPDTFFTSE